MVISLLLSLVKLYRQAIRNPRYGWLVVATSLVYLFSPFDLSPDLLPILGEIDDIVIITVLATEILNIISSNWHPPKTSKIKSEEVQGEVIDVESISLD